MDNIEQLRAIVADMDAEVDFPRTVSEAEQFKSILERIENGIIWQSDLRNLKEWNMFPWLISKLDNAGINVTIITKK